MAYVQGVQGTWAHELDVPTETPNDLGYMYYRAKHGPKRAPAPGPKYKKLATPLANREYCSCVLYIVPVELSDNLFPLLTSSFDMHVLPFHFRLVFDLFYFNKSCFPEDDDDSCL